MSDGAHLGLKPTDALQVIIGGRSSEQLEDQRLKDEEFAAWIRAAPADWQAPPSPATTDSYNNSSRVMAYCFMRIMEENPTLEKDSLTEEVFQDRVYDLAKMQFPEYRLAFRGCTGFMFGWALNAARKVLALPPMRNPALSEIDLTGLPQEHTGE